MRRTSHDSEATKPEVMNYYRIHMTSRNTTRKGLLRAIHLIFTIRNRIIRSLLMRLGSVLHMIRPTLRSHVLVSAQKRITLGERMELSRRLGVDCRGVIFMQFGQNRTPFRPTGDKFNRSSQLYVLIRRGPPPSYNFNPQRSDSASLDHFPGNLAINPLFDGGGKIGGEHGI